MPPARKIVDRSFMLLAAAFLIYAAIYILRLSFTIDGVRYFTLADDQMISMRYAENLAAGSGLVWNAGGPRVEGFTNLLWVLYMAVFHVAGIPRPWISACIQASGAVFLLVNLLLTKRLAEHLSEGSAAAGMIAATLTAFYVPLDNWAFQGTEVSLLTLAVTAIAFVAIRDWDCGPQWRVWLLVGSTTLVRPDTVVIAASLFLVLIAKRPRAWRINLMRGILVLTAFAVAETAFRLWYFGDPLPNTYYVKLTGIPTWMRVSRGGVVTLMFLAQIAPLAWLVFRHGRRREWNRRYILLAVIFGAQLAYNVYIGGDAWEWWGGSNRFVAIAMPLFFVMVATSLIGRCPTSSPFRSVKLAILTTVCVCAANALAFSVWPVGSPIKRLLLIEQPPQTEQDHTAVRAALMLRDLTEPSAVIAVAWAGAIPYFSERPAIDLLGKMDPYIAHQRMHIPQGIQRWLGFVPGHLKWDYAYSIGRLKPDVVQAPLWTLPYVTDNGVPALNGDYGKWSVVTNWYVRNDSGKVRRNRFGSPIADPPIADRRF
jgi:hypothetical protein